MLGSPEPKVGRERSPAFPSRAHIRLQRGVHKSVPDRRYRTCGVRTRLCGRTWCAHTSMRAAAARRRVEDVEDCAHMQIIRKCTHILRAHTRSISSSRMLACRLETLRTAELISACVLMASPLSGVTCRARPESMIISSISDLRSSQGDAWDSDRRGAQVL
jgi:hypothetical protein